MKVGSVEIGNQGVSVIQGSESDDDNHRWFQVNNASMIFGGQLVAHDKSYRLMDSKMHTYTHYIYLYETCHNDVYVVVVFDTDQCDMFLCTDQATVIESAAGVVPYANKDRMEIFIANVKQYFGQKEAGEKWCIVTEEAPE